MLKNSQLLQSEWYVHSDMDEQDTYDLDECNFLDILEVEEGFGAIL